MKISIKSMVIAQIYILLSVGVLTNILGFPSFVKYLLDVNFLIILGYSFVKERKIFLFNREVRGVMIYCLIFMSLICLISILKSVPLGQILWGIRNTYFFIIFMAFSSYYLDEIDIQRIMKVVVRFQWINVLCGIFEFYFLDVHNDYLGGMFGTIKGCNGLLNLYLVVIVSYVVARYIKNKESLLNVSLIIGSSLYMATISELKLFYVELIIIVLLAILIGKKSVKTVLIAVFVVIMIVIGFNFMRVVNIDSIKYMNSIEGIVNYGSRTDYGDDNIRVNRLTAISQINEMFFGNDIEKQLLGYGLGACESSDTFSWCNSQFSDKYDKLQYRNLGSAMIYLEMGGLGLIGYLSIFIYIFIDAQKKRKALIVKEDWALFAQLVSIMCVLNVFYDSSMKREIAYLIFLIFGSYWKRNKTNTI